MENVEWFINDPEKKLGDKYIIFKRLLIEAKNDTTFKATLDAINHFKRLSDLILFSQAISELKFKQSWDISWIFMFF